MTPAHDRSRRLADAWEEGYEAGLLEGGNEGCDCGDYHEATNPYREETP